jgi:hypothetical protein
MMSKVWSKLGGEGYGMRGKTGPTGTTIAICSYSPGVGFLQALLPEHVS